MPFDIWNMKKRKPMRVVAVVGTFAADGTSVIGPARVLMATNDNGAINSGEADIGANMEIGASGLRIDQNDGGELQYLPPRGEARGIYILGTVNKGESDGAAICRLLRAAPVPDLAAVWRNHVSGIIMQAQDTHEALADFAAARGFKFV